jgi:putative glycosyltransferase (TIGR04372 family)
MNYGIWRHENALGNSAEQVVNLSNFIKIKGDNQPVIYVEKEFQKYMAMCIPNAKIIFYDLLENELDRLNEVQKMDKVYKYLENIYMPDVYFNDKNLNYPSVWSNLSGHDNTLRMPDSYVPVMNVDQKTICIQIREPNTYWKRVDGDNNDLERFVDKEIYFQVALHFANEGFKVIRIGDGKQTPMPTHENITDFALNPTRTMLDDLFISSKSKCFLSCDSGIWPMAYALGANLIVSNVTSTMKKGVFYKPEIMNWMDGATIIPKKWHKKWFNGTYIDNSKEELIEAIDNYL